MLALLALPRGILGVSLVSISRSKKSRVATTAATCCIGLDIAGILRSTKTAVSADYVSELVPVTLLQHRSTLADLLTVVLPKPV